MPNTPIERYISLTFQPRAFCEGTDETGDCGKEWPARADTPDNAKWHARNTGHTVVIIKETHSRWGPR